MTVLTVFNEKGGVGKSTIVTQFAFYLRLKRSLRVLAIDLDEQSNSSDALIKSGHFVPLAQTAVQVMTSYQRRSFARPCPSGSLLAASHELGQLESQPDAHDSFSANFLACIADLSYDFDVCVIDTKPSTDVRLLTALNVTSQVLIPIDLNQEAVDGIATVYNVVQAVKSTTNPDLAIMGILPNKVEQKSLQQANFAELRRSAGRLLLPNGEGGYLHIPATQAVADAQAQGKPLWELRTTTHREAWARIEPVFAVLADKLVATSQEMALAAPTH
jgi:chromosome partitioning protein